MGQSNNPGLYAEHKTILELLSAQEFLCLIEIIEKGFQILYSEVFVY